MKLPDPSWRRPQWLTYARLQRSRLRGDRLLIEALLRRGFLAYRDHEGVWLGTGSHAEDLAVLQLVTGIQVEPVSGHIARIARIRFPTSHDKAKQAALGIVAIPENRGFTSNPPFDERRCGRIWISYRNTGWISYRNTAWGSKLPVCPCTNVNKRDLGYWALDIGIALLVKALPLARVSTAFWSCDGHGERPAHITLSERDAAWAKAVIEMLRIPTLYSQWNWNGDLEIAPRGGYSDAQVLRMLNDIQRVARRLLNQSTIDKIGRARHRTLDAFGEQAPCIERFAEEARSQLAAEFV